MLQFATNFLWNHVGKGLKSKSPFGTLTPEQLANRSYSTLKLLSQYLGTKKFFFGDTMSILDMIGKIYMPKKHMTTSLIRVKKTASTGSSITPIAINYFSPFPLQCLATQPNFSTNLKPAKLDKNLKLWRTLCNITIP